MPASPIELKTRFQTWIWTCLANVLSPLAQQALWPIQMLNVDSDHVFDSTQAVW